MNNLIMEKDPTFKNMTPQRIFRNTEEIEHIDYGKGTVVGYVGYIHANQIDKVMHVRVQFDSGEVHDFLPARLEQKLKGDKPKPIKAISSELFVPVLINGYKYYYERITRLLWAEDLQSFSRLNFLTDNERQQLDNELKSVK